MPEPDGYIPNASSLPNVYTVFCPLRGSTIPSRLKTTLSATSSAPSGTSDRLLGWMYSPAGCALIFLNYLDELPLFTQEVLPRLVAKGLRNSMN